MVAYSLRRLTAKYNGSAGRVRRSSDNAESDIGFTSSGNLDTASLLAFIGANSAFVTTWYDQSGNGRNAFNTTASQQPRIVNAGVLDTSFGLPSIYSSTASTLLFIPTLSNMSSALGVFAYRQGNVTPNERAPYELGGGAFTHLPYTDGNAYTGAFSTFRPNFGAYSNSSSTFLHSFIQDGSGLSIYRNSVQVGTRQALAFTIPTGLTIFGGTGSSDCFVQDYIIFNSRSNETRRYIENKLAQRYGINI